MRVRWTVPAADDLANIKRYLQAHNARFAEARLVIDVRLQNYCATGSGNRVTGAERRQMRMRPMRCAAPSRYR